MLELQPCCAEKLAISIIILVQHGCNSEFTSKKITNSGNKNIYFQMLSKCKYLNIPHIHLIIIHSSCVFYNY